MKRRDLITGGEAAVLLCVGPKTISRWANEGRIPVAHVTLGGHRRFLREVIVALAERAERGIRLGSPTHLPPLPAELSIPSVPNQDVFTPSEVAKLCGVERRAVRSWVDQGLLANVGLPGGHARIPREAVVALLERRSPTKEGER